MRIIGVDEAGRGPVLGPMVLAAVMANDSQMETFRDLGVRDSKALTRKARERIYDRLTGLFQIRHELVTPTAINRRNSNLNRLEYEALLRLLHIFRPDRLIVDAFMPPQKLSAEVKTVFPNMSVVAEYKADENHLIVSAASIVAKVIRDREVDRLKAKFGDLGSGYPSDPQTNTWLRAQLLKNRLALRGLPSCVRLRWRTLDRLRDQGRSCEPPDDKITFR